MRLELLSEVHAISRLGPEAGVPVWAAGAVAAGTLLSVSRTAEELSIVCPEVSVPVGLERSGGWRALRVAGTLEHDLTGILVALAAPLAEAAIPIFAVSTHDTDYLLVPGGRLAAALAALRAAGHEVGERGDG